MVQDVVTVRDFQLTYIEAAAEALEKRLADLGFNFKKLPLKTLPEAVHWHITKPASNGTLEATWDPGARRFWLSTRTNRYAKWQDEAIAAITAAINRP